jgi:hypothetical protein
MFKFKVRENPSAFDAYGKSAAFTIFQCHSCWGGSLPYRLRYSINWAGNILFSRHTRF